jgi:tRNA A37 threonylcarbamoyladenosine synthetase subunit TsaC/SUA5/YrdC
LEGALDDCVPTAVQTSDLRISSLTIFDFERDARRAFDALKAGGIAIVPNDIGYSILGGSHAALRRIFATKGRAASKLNAMVGNADIQRELHILSPRGRDMVSAITEDYDLPIIRCCGR